MRHDEDYTAHIFVAFMLTVIILLIFQIYIIREPTRIEEHTAADHVETVNAGRDLFAEHCAACHGENGEGGVGPALNSRQLLSTANDELLFSLTRTGIPSTKMPAWGQSFGGPFTDAEIVQLVTFIREWEKTAPEISTVVATPDPQRGATIYTGTCSVCHGANGTGTDIAPALNDARRLSRLDDSWYRNTISRGRPARGMPTWGTVLSPQQIDDLVALIAAWRSGETVGANTPYAVYVASALYAVQDFDPEDGLYYLNAALPLAAEEQQAEIGEIITLVTDNQLFEAQTRIAGLLPPEEMGRALFITQCAACHGEDGIGRVGPNLHNNAFIQSQDDPSLIHFFLTGRPNTPMNSFSGILLEDEISNLIVLLRTWQN
jgi:mono/diheme cytochrome c family protein